MSAGCMLPVRHPAAALRGKAARAKFLYSSWGRSIVAISVALFLYSSWERSIVAISVALRMVADRGMSVKKSRMYCEKSMFAASW